MHGAPGADRIVEWINAHLEEVRIVPTEIGVDQQRRIEEGRSISRPRRAGGDRGARPVSAQRIPEAEALLLFEDTDIERRRAIVDERVSLISTGDFLRELEAAGLIQSTDFILDRAAAQGRNVERQREASRDAAARERLRAQLEGDAK